MPVKLALTSPGKSATNSFFLRPSMSPFAPSPYPPNSAERSLEDVPASSSGEFQQRLCHQPHCRESQLLRHWHVRDQVSIIERTKASSSLVSSVLSSDSSFKSELRVRDLSIDFQAALLHLGLARLFGLIALLVISFVLLLRAQQRRHSFPQ